MLHRSDRTMTERRQRSAQQPKECVQAPAPLKSLARRCLGLTKRGNPCQFGPLDGQDYCLWHSPDPGTQQKAKLAAQKGALASAPRYLPKDHPAARIRSVEEALVMVEETIQAVRVGELGANVANSVFYGVSVASKLLELQVLEQLEALEAAVGVRFGRRSIEHGQETHSGVAAAASGWDGRDAGGGGSSLPAAPVE